MFHRKKTQKPFIKPVNKTCKIMFQRKKIRKNRLKTQQIYVSKVKKAKLPF